MPAFRARASRRCVINPPPSSFCHGPVILRLSIARRSILRALHRRKGRDQEGAYLAEGERLVAELAASGVRPRFLVARADRIDGLVELFPESEVCEIEGGGDDLFATEHAQGVAAVVDLPPTAPANDALAVLPTLYLDRLADPGNVGTILRTADWFGLRHVLLSPETADPYNPKGVRATMGAIFRMRFSTDVSAAELAGLGVPVIVLDAAGADVLGRTELPRDAVYVVGSEAHGVAREILAFARSVAIAGSGSGESLNAAVAAGILLHELHRGD